MNGVAIGFRYTATDIRFAGISYGGTEPALTMVTLTVEGDLIKTIKGQIGYQAVSLWNLRGIF